MVLSMSRPFKHPKTGIYYFRRVVPLDIRPVVGKWEDKRTLGTKDPTVARKLHAVVAATVEREWSDLRLSLVKSSGGSVDIFAMRAFRSAAESDDRPNPEVVRFADIIPQTAQVTHVGPANGRDGLTFTALSEGWWREAKVGGTAEATRVKYVRAVSLLGTFLGHDDVAKVTAADVVRFKDYRLSVIDPKTGRSLATSTVRSGDLAPLKAVFGWAVNNLHILSNPAEKITLKVGRTQRLRSKAFTDAEARALLAAASSVVRGREAYKTYAAKRWVPWLCAYTGARVGEMVQLRLQDVRQEGDLWVVRISPEAGTVKTNIAHDVVLHEHIIELGFLEFLRTSEMAHLFLVYKGSENIMTQLASTTGILRKASRDIIDDNGVAPNHGWRHRFKTICRDIGVSQRIMDAIQGHATRSESDNYGEVSLRAQALALSRFPRQG